LTGEAGSPRHSRATLIAAGAILINFALLAGSLSDYRVTIDSAYHVSIARQWGEHWLVPSDTGLETIQICWRRTSSASV
jgi:hypothetical protein